MSNPEVTIAIVSYNTRELLGECLRSIRTTTGVSYEVIVVDNGSSDGSPEAVTREFLEVDVVSSAENRGFAAASNIALRQARGRFLLLLNPDTVVGPRTVGALAEFLDQHPRAGACGPRILFPDGTFQSCGYHFPTPLSEVRMSKRVGRVLRAVVGEEPPPPSGSVPYECDWVDGACLMIRRSALDQVGPLDEQYFLYSEEMDWCFAARKAGWQIHALPQVEMFHHRGKSSEQVSERSLSWLVETKLRFFRKHHGVATALFVSVVNAAGFVKLMRQEPRKNRAKLKGVRQFWASVWPRAARATPRGSRPGP